MARGIEHREKGTVLDAYRFTGKPNWAIFAGRDPVVTYEGGDMEEGEQRLSEYLSIIEDSANKGVYVLRTYSDNQTNITNKTPFNGSTTMMLNSDVPVTADPKTGLMIIDRQRESAKYFGDQNKVYERLEALEKSNELLRKDLMAAQLKAIEEKFESKISGLEQKNDPWASLVDSLTKRPEILTDTIGNIVNLIRGKKEVDYVHTNPMAGTSVKSVPDMPTQESNNISDLSKVPKKGNIENKNEIEPETELSEMAKKEITEEKDLTEQELEALHDKQSDACDKIEDIIGVEVLTAYLEGLAGLNESQFENWYQQNKGLTILNQRLAPEVVTKMVTQVASLDDKALNKLLNYLD